MTWLQSVPLRIAIALISCIATWYALYLLGPSLHINDPAYAAAIVVGSIVLHEIGHMIAYYRHGVQSWMFFLVLLGGVVPLDIDKANRISDSAKAEVALAGLMMNALIIGGAFAADVANLISQRTAWQIMNLNAALMLFNMIPFAILDGSRFVILLFNNIAPTFARKLFQITSIPVIIGMMIALYVKGDVALALPLILVGLWSKSRGNREPTSGLMSREQRILWAVVYAYLVAFALIIFMTTPNWNLR